MKNMTGGEGPRFNQALAFGGRTELRLHFHQKYAGAGRWRNDQGAARRHSGFLRALPLTLLTVK